MRQAFEPRLWLQVGYEFVRIGPLRIVSQRYVCNGSKNSQERWSMPRNWFFAILILLLAASTVSPGQTITTLKNQPPDGAGIAFLLTDGTVVVQGNGESDWAKLTPDNKGSYINGTWKRIASLPSGYVPNAFASAVLADGRLIIEGGEYNNGHLNVDS